MRPVAAVLLIVTLFPATSSGQGRILRWVALVQAHEAGSPDAELKEIAEWRDADVQSVVTAIRSLADSLDRHPRAAMDIDGQRYTADQVRALCGIPSAQVRPDGANRILQLGATLHGDIAGLLPHVGGGSGESSVMVQDGRHVGMSPHTIHWTVGRTLLDGVLPSPAADADALAWYRATSARMLHLGDLSESMLHLAKAYRVFPRDSVLLLDEAYLHEQLASPGSRAGIDSALQLRGLRLDVGSLREELEQAERWFRATIAVDQENVTARLRLARVITELGRPEEAQPELRSVLARESSPEDVYLARLFLGRAEELLGHRDAARDEFQRASTLFPRAQSPQLALSRIARESGDRESSRRWIQALAELPTDEHQREDPWWYYYEIH